LAFGFVLSASVGCGAHRTGVVDPTDDDRRLANLQRAATLPWSDDGRCAVREAQGEWADLVHKCYDALDTSRIRFSDRHHQCPVAQLEAATTAVTISRVVAICLLAQPQIMVGVVVVVGTAAVAAYIATEIEAARQKKPGCRCLCIKEGEGPDSRFGRVASKAECKYKCQQV
jgi:hypothetical protein